MRKHANCHKKVFLSNFSISGRIHCAAACAVATDCDAYYYEQSECHTSSAKDLIGADEIDEENGDAQSVFMDSLLSTGNTFHFMKAQARGIESYCSFS